MQTFAQGSGGSGLLGRILEGVQADADVRVVIPSGFSPISVSLYGIERMRKSLRDLAWFLRETGQARRAASVLADVYARWESGGFEEAPYIAYAVL